MAHDVRQHLTTKAHPYGWTFVLIDLVLSRLARGAHAARAQLDLFGLVATGDGNSLDIRIETPSGMPLAEAYSISKRRSFATFSAFRHGKPDLLGFRTIGMGL
jgi:hypothetical protein